MIRIWYFLLERFRFTYLVILAIVFAGLFTLYTLPREANPEIKIPIGVVTTIYPGASALDVERLITDEIEDAVDGLDELDSYTSTSSEGLSTVIVNFEAKADIPDRIRALRDAISSVERRVPADAEDPIVTEISFSDQPIIVFALSADLSESELKKMSEEAQDKLEAISGVSEVDIAGVRGQEVLVNVDKSKLDQFGVSLNELVAALQTSHLTFPVGSIRSDDIRYTVRLDAELKDPSEFAQIPVKQNDGAIVYLRDVADVSLGLSPSTTFSRVSVNGQPSENAVSLSVKKKTGGNITKIADQAKEAIEELRVESYPEASSIITFDAAKEVQKSLSSLVNNGIMTIILIAVLLFMFLGPREALLAGVSIPFTFLIGFIGLAYFGATINFLSLFSLILALGIVVDNGIVITEGMHENLKKGYEPIEAAKRTLNEFQYPLISGTLTTVAAFVPMLFMSGIIGQFIRHIPITVNFVLIGSLFTALGIMPLLATKFLKDQKPGRIELLKKKYMDPAMERLHNWYEAKIRYLLSDKKRRKRFALTVILGFVLAMALPITGFLKVIMFPEDNADFFNIDVEAPLGTSLRATDEIVRQIEEELYTDERVESFYVNVGAGNAFADDGGGRGTNLASFTVNLHEGDHEPTPEIVSSYRDRLSFISDADVSVSQLGSGPATGAPVLITFTGTDLAELERLALQAQDILEQIPGTAEVSTSLQDASFEFVLSVNRDRALSYGLTPAQIGQVLRTAVTGTDATEFRYEGDDLDVIVTQALNPSASDVDERISTSINELEQMEVVIGGQPVKLASFVDVQLAPARSSIPHEDGERISKVTSQVSGTTATQVFAEFTKHESELDLQEGYAIKMGGEAEDVAESFRDLFRALFIGVFLIASILLLQFNSYRQPLFIMVTLPLALIGVFFGLAITGQALSFPAFIGIVALSGVVVNDAIILIDKINRNRKDGMERFEAIVDAGKSRLQPILLTTVTTVAGIAPLAVSDPIWRGLGASIIFGLMFATILTLAVVPMLYLKWGEETLS